MYYPGKKEKLDEVVIMYFELFGRLLLTCYLGLREWPENVPIRVQMGGLRIGGSLSDSPTAWP